MTGLTTPSRAAAPGAVEFAAPVPARRVRRDRTLVAALAVLVALAVISFTAPLWWAESTTATDPAASLEAPSGTHPMGTDEVGRDVFARFLAGARISLAVGAVVALVSGLVGSLLAIAAARRGGAFDVVLMRVFDIVLAFPPLVLAMAIAAGLGAGLKSACLGIVLSFIPFIGRVVRSDTLRVLTSGYVESAVALGASPWRVTRHHVVPHVMPTILVQVGTQFAFAILAIAALGFIGLGAQIPTPEWGAMTAQGSKHLITGEWWVSVFPGIGIVLVTCAAMVAAERARALLDPHSAARMVTA